MMSTGHLGSNDFATQAAAFLRASPVVRASVANISTRIEGVGSGETLVPVTINACEPDNSWVCSPYTTYCRYAVEELHRFGHPLLTTPLSAICRGLGAYLAHARLDQAVAINNWLVSTNLYPRIDKQALAAWIEEALQRWPQHAIWFRSLNPRYTADWLAALEETGCTLIPSRQVYLYDRIHLDRSKPINLVRDIRLMRSTELVVSEARSWNRSDFERAADLYAQLYLRKYSRFNPAYSATFLNAWHDAGLLELIGYRDDRGVLQGVVGLFTLDTTITAPIVGYALEQRERWSLYRLLMAKVFEIAAQRGHRINLSAGAADFKRVRGGSAAMEYSAVYASHLPKGRRIAINVLAQLAGRIGEPIMRRFEL